MGRRHVDVLPPVRTDVAVTLGTLAAASVLEPTRRRVQRAVDRRFNRTRYDAVQPWSVRGSPLHELDAPTVREDLLQTVLEALQPSTIAVYECSCPDSLPR